MRLDSHDRNVVVVVAANLDRTDEEAIQKRRESIVEEPNIEENTLEKLPRRLRPIYRSTSCRT
jgi:hypothetical protein